MIIFKTQIALYFPSAYKLAKISNGSQHNEKQLRTCRWLLLACPSSAVELSSSQCSWLCLFQYQFCTPLFPPLLLPCPRTLSYRSLLVHCDPSGLWPFCFTFFREHFPDNPTLFQTDQIPLLYALIISCSYSSQLCRRQLL